MKQDKFIYYPLFASRRLNGGRQDDQEKEQVRAALFKLESSARLRLMSSNFAEAVSVLEDTFSLPEQFVEYVTVLIRDLYFGNFSEMEVLRALRSEFAKLPNIPIDSIIQHIQLNILKAEPDVEPQEEEEEKEAEEILAHPEYVKKYILLDAMARFPNIGNQLITTANIKLKSQALPVRPSLSNWLKNYRDEIGIGKHDAVARARFLFESYNTRGLQSGEREKLHALVRSLEDNELLEINTKNQTVVFAPEKKEVTPVARYQTSKQVLSAPDPFERFSVPQPREELKNVGTQTFVPKKAFPKETLNSALDSERGEEKKEDAVLARIKSMMVTPPPAHGLAPREDFMQPQDSQEPQQAMIPVPQEPLGTMRFSTKHILPAEKYQASQTPQEKRAGAPADSRLEHFRPQGIERIAPPEPAPIPEYQAVAESVPISSILSGPPKTIPVPTAPPRNVQPSSIFRIKPNKN